MVFGKLPINLANFRVWPGLFQRPEQTMGSRKYQQHTAPQKHLMSVKPTTWVETMKERNSMFFR